MPRGPWQSQSSGSGRSWRALLTTAVALLIASGSPIAAQTAEPDEAQIAAEFKAFAETEAERLKASWKRYEGQFFRSPVGTPIPMTIPKKFLFSGTKLESVPTSYAFDVQRTNSIITPYVAFIEFPIVMVSGSVFVKGKKKQCANKTLDQCLQAGGQIFETGLLYKSHAYRVPQTFKYEYVYQDGAWKPKQDFDEALTQAVATMNIFSPLQPGDAAKILQGDQ